MKNIFKRAAVFAAALGMALTSFSCAGKNSSADESGHGNLVGNSPPDGAHICLTVLLYLSLKPTFRSR